MLDSKGSLRDDMRDAVYLFDFVTEKPRSVAEVEEEVNKLAHEKYCLDSWGRGTKAGHNLRCEYKRFLRRNLKRMLRLYDRLKKQRRENGL